MDVNLFSRMIVSLLSKNGKAGLGDFGTFTTEVVPAYFSDKGFTINPPYLKVSFSSVPSKDDSLVRLYAQSNEVEPPRAELLINAQLAALRREVLDKKDVTLPGLGRLRATSSGDIFFIQGDGLELFPAYDALESVSMKSLHPESSVPAKLSEVAQPQSIPDESVPVAHVGPEVKEEAPAFSEKPAEKPRKVEDDFSDDIYEKPSALKITLIVLLVLCVLALAAFSLLGHLHPEIVDEWLYTPEQLEILRYKF